MSATVRLVHDVAVTYGVERVIAPAASVQRLSAARYVGPGAGVCDHLQMAPVFGDAEIIVPMWVSNCAV